jgi:uncharacterized FAD-dependent dehydrogenase
MVSVDLNQLYPKDMNDRLREGLLRVCKKMPGFKSEQAILTAPESRTSSPVRVPRNQDFMHPSLTGLFPCGEGAGYAGGIVSAGIDGINAAKSCADKLLHLEL